MKRQEPHEPPFWMMVVILVATFLIAFGGEPFRGAAMNFIEQGLNKETFIVVLVIVLFYLLFKTFFKKK